jgi:hypothetical protein
MSICQTSGQEAAAVRVVNLLLCGTAQQEAVNLKLKLTIKIC